MPDQRANEAEIRLDPLLQLSARSKAFEVFVVDENGMLLAHSDRQRVVRRERSELAAEIGKLDRRYGANLTRELARDEARLVGSFVRTGAL